MSDDDRPWHRVAIVTFMELQGIDPSDAAGGAVIGMNQVLRPGTHVPFQHQNRSLGPGEMRIVQHMEVGMAAGNGYLWTEPTSRAYRNYRMPWDPPEDDE